MADLSVTAANVVPQAGASIVYGTAGETIAAGKVVYLASTGLWMLADNNAAAALRTPGGIALTSSSLNQPIVVCDRGPVAFGAIFTAGLAYYLSATAGGICPVADVTTGMTVSALGIATTTSILNININASGVQL
jgi:hypothetical protein